MEEYVVDTNLATFILDGELWGREPASLVKARPELLVAYRLASEELAKVPLFYEPLRRSNVALEWYQKEAPRIILPLTVQAELSVSLQVSANT